MNLDHYNRLLTALYPLLSRADAETLYTTARDTLIAKPPHLE